MAHTLMNRPAPSARRRCVLALLMSGVGLGCTEFRTVLRDFDRIAGIDGDSVPAQLDYPAGLEAWLTLSDQAGLEVPEEAQENPSGYARSRLVSMVAKARGDRLAICTAMHRLFIVAAADPGVLNRIEAYEGISTLLDNLQSSPLEVVRSVEAGDQRERTAEVLADIRALGPARRGDATGPVSEADQARYSAALERSGVAPMASAADGRQLLRMLIDDVRAMGGGRAVPAQPMMMATERVAQLEATRVLFQALRAPDARLREAAAVVLYQASGPELMPMILETSAQRVPGGGRLYASTVRERRSLLRLCSQMRGEVLLTRASEGSPRVLDFVYDTVARDEDEGLRLLALETMARCLERPVSFDPSWADSWWREFALRDGE